MLWFPAGSQAPGLHYNQCPGQDVPAARTHRMSFHSRSSPPDDAAPLWTSAQNRTLPSFSHYTQYVSTWMIYARTV